jgi:hypothetical protein
MQAVEEDRQRRPELDRNGDLRQGLKKQIETVIAGHVEPRPALV